MKALLEFVNGTILHAGDILLISTAVGDAPVDGVAEESHGRGAFLMQAAAGDPDLAAVMPSTEVVNAVLAQRRPHRALLIA